MSSIHEITHIITVKSRAVDRSTIQFLTIFGVLLTKTCYYPRRATIAMSSNHSTDEYIKGCLKSFFFSCKCIFINKDWEKSDQNSWGSYILVEKVDDFGIRFDLLAWIRYGVCTYLLLLTKTCYNLNFGTFWGCY